MKFQLWLAVIISSLFWLLLTPGISTVIKLEHIGPNLVASINHRRISTIPFSDPDFVSLSLDLSPNYPLPGPFTSRVIKISGNGIDLCTQHCPNQVLFPSGTQEVTITLHNSLYAQLNLNNQHNTYYQATYRPFHDRDFSLAHFNGQQFDINQNQWRQYQLSFAEAILFIGLIVKPAIPFLILILIVAFFLPKTSTTKNIFKKPSSVPVLITIIFFSTIFSYLLWVNTRYVARIPHSPDSVAYLWASKYLASGRLWLPPPSPFFSFISEQPVNNHWAILWPIGHPLVLAIGSLFHVPWIIPPLIGTITLILFYLLCLPLFGKLIAYLSTAIFFLSPFFQMHATTFMSHNTAAFFTMILIFFFHRYFQNKSTLKLALVAGISLAFLTQIRPFTSVAVAVSGGLFIGALAVKNRRFPPLVNILFFSLSTLFFVGLFLLINKFSYGTYFDTPYKLVNQTKTVFGNPHITIYQGLTDSVANLLVLRQVIFPGLPTLFFLLFLISLIGRSHRLFKFFCLTNIFLIYLSSLFFDDFWGLFYGPRFWYEMIPFIFLLLAFSLDNLRRIFVYQHLYLIIFWGILITIGYKSILGWTLNRFPLWTNMFFATPDSIPALSGFNFTDDRLLIAAKRLNLHQALIFVKDCGGGWWCYGSVFAQNTPDFDGDLVWAKDLGVRNQELINSFPQRTIYQADYHSGQILPYTERTYAD